jgi:hypothetical protein
MIQMPWDFKINISLAVSVLPWVFKVNISLAVSVVAAVVRLSVSDRDFSRINGINWG